MWYPVIIRCGERSARSVRRNYHYYFRPEYQGIFTEVRDGKSDRGDAIAEISEVRMIRNFTLRHENKMYYT